MFTNDQGALRRHKRRMLLYRAVCAFIILVCTNLLTGYAAIWGLATWGQVVIGILVEWIIALVIVMLTIPTSDQKG